MGFLDDAIREHLDLKRRRGADPTEIEQAEREALGPVRRGSFERAADEPESAVVEREPAYDHTAEPGYEEYQPPAENGHEWGDPFDDEASIAEEPPVSAGPAEPYEEPAPAPPPPDAPETVEYDVEGAFAEEEAEPPPPEPPAHQEPSAPGPEQREAHPGDEDVLEETPEFLQDAPEHDRLWFEQRPPRDFDFDG